MADIKSNDNAKVEERRSKSREAMKRKRANMTEEEKLERRIKERKRRADKKTEFSALMESRNKAEIDKEKYKRLAEKLADKLLLIKQTADASHEIHTLLDENTLIEINLLKVQRQKLPGTEAVTRD